MQIRGTTTSRNRTKEEEEKKKKSPAAAQTNKGGAKTKPATKTPSAAQSRGSSPKGGASTKPRTTPAKEQRNSGNYRTQRTNTQLTDGGSSRSRQTPQFSGSGSRRTVTDSARVHGSSGGKFGSQKTIKKQIQSSVPARTKLSQWATMSRKEREQTLKELDPLNRKGSYLKDNRDQVRKAANETPEQRDARLRNAPLPVRAVNAAAKVQERRNRNKEIDAQLAQLRQIRDDKKAFEMTDKLPDKVKGLLDDYNRTSSAMEGLRAAGGNADISTYMQVRNQQNGIARALSKAGYKNYEELAAWRKRVTDREEAERLEQQATQFGQEHPVLGAAAARVLSPVAAVVTAAENVGDLVRGEKTDAQTLNTYSAGWAPTRMKNALDQGVQSNFTDGLLSRETQNFLYQTLSSGVDSLVASAVPGVGEAILGLGAANDTIMNVAQKGGTKGQAILSGLAAGVAESLFEHVSIGNLRAMKEVPTKTVGDVLKNLAKGTVTNFSEEALTEVANVMTDYLINGGNSDYYNTVMQCKQQGMTDQQAKAVANRQLGQRILEAGAGGALMGGAFGAIGTATGRANYNRATQQQGAQIAAQDGGRERVLAGAQDVLEGGGLGSKQQKQLEKAIGQAEAGATESGRSRKDERALGALAQQVDEATSKDTAQIVAEEAGKRLQKLGETGDTARVAQAIGEVVAGTAEDGKAAKIIQKSTYGRQVMAELEQGTAWTQRIGERVGALQERRYAGVTAAQQQEAQTDADFEARPLTGATAQIAQVLEQMGEAQPETVARAIVQTAAGRETRSTRDTLAGSRFGQQVLEQVTGGRTEQTSPVSAQERAATLPTFGEGKETAGERRSAAKAAQDGKMSTEARELAKVHYENALLNGNDVTPEAFVKDWRDVYEFGRSGNVTLEQVIEDAPNRLTEMSEEAMRDAFRAGERAGQTSPVSGEETPSVASGDSSPRGGAKEAAGARRSAAQAAIVTAIKQVTADGDVTVQLQDGSTASAADVELLAPVRKIIEFAAAYDTRTANAFLQGAVQAESVSGFREAFKAFYGAGRLGKMSYDEYRQTAEGRILGGKLTKEAAKAAFDGGRKAAEAEKASTSHRKGGKSGGKSEKREGSYKNSAAIDKAVDTMLELLAKKTGFDFERLQRVSGGKVEANGRFIRALCKIEISDNAQNFFGDTQHELTHGAAAFNPEGYSGYAGAVMQWYQQTYGSGSAMDRLQEIYNTYHQNDESFTMADALEEFTSEANAGLFSSEEGAQDFVNWLQSESGYTAEQKKTVLQKAAELLQKIFDRIKELLRDGHLSSVAKDFAQAQADEAARLRQMFLEVLDGMEVNQSTVDSQQSTGGEKFSIKRSTEGFDFVDVDEEAIDLNDGRSIASVIAEFVNNRFINNIIKIKGQSIRINATTKHEWIGSEEAKRLYDNGTTAYDDKIKAIANADEILEAAKGWIGEKPKHNKFKEFTRGNVFYKVGENGYKADVVVGIKENGSAILYDMVSISEYKITEAPFAKGNRNSLRGRGTSVEYTLPQTVEDVNTESGKNSLRMADQTSPVSAQERAATLPTFGEGKEAAGGLAEEAAQMEQLRHSLGIEAQNSRLAQKVEGYEQLTRQQDVKIRQLQRELSRAGVKVYANSGKVRNFASGLLRDYGAQRIQGLDRRKITDAMEALYNSMANDGASRDTAQIQAGEIAERILSQSKYLNPEISEYSRTILDDVKSVGVRLSDAQKQEAAYRYGSYGAFYRQTFGKLKIRNDGVSLDSRWQELAAAYPNIFDATASDADQPALLLEAVTALQNDYSDENGFDYEEAKELLTGQILNGFSDTVAGSQAVAAKQRQAAQQIHDEYEQRIARMKADQKRWAAAAQQKAKELVRQAKTDTAVKLRAEYDEKFLANRARYEQRAQNIADTQLKQAQRRRIEQRLTRLRRMLAPTRGSDNVVQQLRPVTQAMLDVFPESRMDGFKKESWTTLKETYEGMVNEYEDFAGVYGEVTAQIVDDIVTLREQTADKRFSQLSLRQLQTISKIMDHVNTMIKNENEVLIDGRKQQTAQIGQQVLRETKQRAQKFRAQAGEKLKNASVNNLKPGYFFARLGDTMQRLYKSMEHGQDDWARSVQDGKTFLEAQREAFHYNDWKNRRETVTLREGNEGKSEQLELTVGQMLSLYATAKREGLQVRPAGGKQTMHLLGGGIVLPEQFKKKDGRWQRDDKRHNLTIEDIQEIAGKLTQEQKQYADKMVAYLSTTMAEKGNAVTRELYGFDMFNEGYYFPLNTEGAYRFQKFGEQGESMLQALGFTNATKRNAATPIVLGEFDEVWANHVERMSAYSSLVVPIASMQRVWNYKEAVGGFGRDNTVAAEFRSSYGQKYIDYFKQFMKDINGDMMGDKRAAELVRWLTKFKKNAVFASLSVTVQQPSAIMRVTPYIEEKYLLQTVGCNRGKMYKEAKQYTGVAIIKEMGGFDVGSGKTAVSWMLESGKPQAQGIKGKLQAAGEKVDNLAGLPAGKADEITWAHIWAAAKAKVKAEEHLSGEKLNRRAAEIFTEAITMTQVYDSVFSRSAYMRSADGLMKAATAFMGEPTTTVNMLEHALFYQKNKMFAFKTVRACLAATLLNAILKSLITTGRDKDEDESLLEKYIGQVVGNFWDDAFLPNLLPIFRDVSSLLQGFDVSRSELAPIADLTDALHTLMTKQSVPLEDKLKGLAGALGPFVNLPVRNLIRDLWDMPRHLMADMKRGTQTNKKGVARSIKRNIFPILTYFKQFGEDEKKSQLYDEWIAASKGEKDQMYTRLAKQYSSGQAVQNALVEEIKNRFDAGVLSQDEASKQLQMLPDFNKAKANEKVRSWQTAKSYELQEDLFADDANTGDSKAYYFDAGTMAQQNQAAEDADDDYKAKYGYLHDALATGDKQKIQKEIDWLKDNGRSEKEINSEIRKYMKNNDPDLQRAAEKYKNGDVSVLTAGAVGVFADKYGLSNAEVMQAIRTAAGVTNSPIDGTDWQLNDLKRAIESGSADTYDIKWAIVKAKEQQFKDKKNPTNAAFESLRASLTSYFKPKYQAADAAGRERIRQQLAAASVWPNQGMLNSTLRKWAQG